VLTAASAARRGGEETIGKLAGRMSMTVRTGQKSVPLSEGVSIPLIGFGTWQLDGDDAYNGTRAALDIGYRHIDTATAYDWPRAGAQPDPVEPVPFQRAGSGRAAEPPGRP
jgi:hypothetical protein